MIAILFKCGHHQKVDPDKTMSPVCHCGERQIARTLNAPAPRFTGAASGPLAHTKAIDAMDVSGLMQTKPLKLKDHGEPDART